MSRMLRAGILLLAGLLAVAYAQDNVCALNELPNLDPQKKMFLPKFAKNFELNIEQTMLGKQIVQQIHMDYSQPNQRMHVKIEAPNNQSEFWIDAKRDLFLGIGADKAIDYGCVYKKLDSELSAVFLGFVDTSGGSIVIGSPEEALHLLTQQPSVLTYVGPGTVRGIPTHRWQACQVSPDISVPVSVIFHFANNSMTVPFIDQPLLAAIFNTSIGGKYISYRYDYVNMKDLPRSDADLLLPPPGTYCFGETSATNIPKMPRAFSFKTEVIYLGDPLDIGTPPSIDYTQQEYIEAYHLYTKYMLTNSANDNYGDYAMTVHDFNLMLAYRVDLISGLCVVSPISLDGVDDILGNGGKIRMDNPQEFFHLNSNYQYIGVRRHESRGIDCDVWVTFERDPHNPAITTEINWWFATQDWKTTNGIAGASQPLPVSMESITVGPDQSSIRIFNVYEYSTKPFNKRPDYSSCFTPQQKIRVAMELTGGTYYNTYLGDAKTFEDNLVLALLLHGNFISPTRIVEINVEPGQGNTLIATFVIIGGFTNNLAAVGGDFPSPMTIFQTLQSNIGFQFEVTDGNDGHIATLTATGIKQINGKNSGGSSGYSSGSMAGIAFGLLIVGFLVGGLAAFLVRRFRASRNYGDGLGTSLGTVSK